MPVLFENRPCVSMIQAGKLHENGKDAVFQIVPALCKWGLNIFPSDRIHGQSSVLLQYTVYRRRKCSKNKTSPFRQQIYFFTSTSSSPGGDTFYIVAKASKFRDKNLAKATSSPINQWQSTLHGAKL